MFARLTIVLLLTAMSAHAQMMGVGGMFYPFKHSSEMTCEEAINSLNGVSAANLSGLSDFQAPFVMKDGKIKVTDDKAIFKSTKKQDRVSFTVPMFTMNGLEYAPVDLIIKKADGKLISATFGMTEEEQRKRIEIAKKAGQTSFEYIQTNEYLFENKGGNCRLSQVGAKNSPIDKTKGTAATSVFYDRKYCENIDPILKRLGTNNVAECANLFGQAERSFTARSTELAKENKTLWGFAPPSGSGGAFNLIYLINLCSTLSMPGSGMFGGYPATGAGEGVAAPAF